MPDSYDQTESRIQSALASIKPDMKPNFSKLAEKYSVPYQRLLARYKGRVRLYERPSGTLKLTSSQNFVLREFIRYLDSLGIPPRLRHVVHCANTILRD